MSRCRQDELDQEVSLRRSGEAGEDRWREGKRRVDSRPDSGANLDRGSRQRRCMTGRLRSPRAHGSSHAVPGLQVVMLSLEASTKEGTDRYKHLYRHAFSTRPHRGKAEDRRRKQGKRAGAGRKQIRKRKRAYRSRSQSTTCKPEGPALPVGPMRLPSD